MTSALILCIAEAMAFPGLIFQKLTIQYIWKADPFWWRTIYCLHYLFRTHLNITRPLKTTQIGTVMSKYILPSTHITCIFVKLFFLFKGSYKNRLKDALEQVDVWKIDNSIFPTSSGRILVWHVNTLFSTNSFEYNTHP
jgi:hypothetical protein